MKGSCHCGEVAIAVPSAPGFLNRCNCTLCTKLGALWGYYPADDVAIAGTPRVYHRADVEAPKLGFHFCGRCGATTHWAPLDDASRARLGVNMGLFDMAELSGVELRYGDRRHAGRADPPSFYRDPTIFDGRGALA